MTRSHQVSTKDVKIEFVNGKEIVKYLSRKIRVKLFIYISLSTIYSISRRNILVEIKWSL
jgi:hypothetical protein